MESTKQWLEAKWPTPYTIKALTTKRLIYLDDKYRDFNLGLHASKTPELVEENRQMLYRILGLEKPITWLNQVHKADVLVLPHEGSDTPKADAVITSKPHEVCAIITGDCLPILLCDKQGEVVAAIHGGWRSLSQNIIQNTIDKIRSITHAPLIAWLGPAIGPQSYEVGPEVKKAFLQCFSELEPAFLPNEKRETHFFLDLYKAAKILLKQAGVQEVYGGGHCTYMESNDYYSHRRDPECGRMATLIWKSA